jgi:hypothetical protein
MGIRIWYSQSVLQRAVTNPISSMTQYAAVRQFDATVKLRDHECVLVYCERGFRHVTLSSLEADGNVSKWFSSWRKLF